MSKMNTSVRTSTSFAHSAWASPYLTGAAVLLAGLAIAWLWTGLSLLAVAIAEAVWALSVRARIRDGEIGVGAGRLNPLVVARGVAIAKASAWVGALALGWWLGVLAYLLTKRSELRVATADTPGAVVAALSAFALIVAALWLQYCCRSPNDPNADREPSPE